MEKVINDSIKTSVTLDFVLLKSILKMLYLGLAMLLK